jgi:hypothetical protein
VAPALAAGRALYAGGRRIAMPMGTGRTSVSAQRPTSDRAGAPQGRLDPAPIVRASIHPTKEHIMGKYVIGWFLGVPVVVLVLAYLVFH